jgi:hypothetical protein
MLGVTLCSRTPDSEVSVGSSVLAGCCCFCRRFEAVSELLAQHFMAGIILSGCSEFVLVNYPF